MMIVFHAHNKFGIPSNTDKWPQHQNPSTKSQPCKPVDPTVKSIVAVYRCHWEDAVLVSINAGKKVAIDVLVGGLNPYEKYELTYQPSQILDFYGIFLGIWYGLLMVFPSFSSLHITCSGNRPSALGNPRDQLAARTFGAPNRQRTKPSAESPQRHHHQGGWVALGGGLVDCRNQAA